VRAANGSLFGFAGGPGASPVPLKPDTTGATDLGSLREASEATPVALKPDTTGGELLSDNPGVVHNLRSSAERLLTVPGEHHCGEDCGSVCVPTGKVEGT
jgi:hypothetical protein